MGSDSQEGLASTPGGHTHRRCPGRCGVCVWGEAGQIRSRQCVHDLGMRSSASFQSRHPKPKLLSGTLLSLACRPPRLPDSPLRRHFPPPSSLTLPSCSSQTHTAPVLHSLPRAILPAGTSSLPPCSPGKVLLTLKPLLKCIRKLLHLPRTLLCS